MFRKLVRKTTELAFRRAIGRGEARCPACGEAPVGELQSWDEILRCGACGNDDVVGEWLSHATGRPRGWADKPPADTKIRREARDDAAVVWHIPASGKSDGFMAFGLFWCAFIGLISGAILYAVLFGTGNYIESGSRLSPWVSGMILVLFFGVFWAIGLGMLYVAVRNKWSRTQVVVDAGKVVDGGKVMVARSLLGCVTLSEVPRDAVTAVELAEFYQNDDVPVHGIEIRAGKRKLKFGSMLRDVDKGWLAADLKKVILGGAGGTSQIEESVEELQVSGLRRQSSFSIRVPTARSHLWPIAVLLSLIGTGFLVVGVFLLDDMGFDGVGPKAPWFVRGFEIFFSFMAGGFRILWLFLSGLMAAIGIGMTVHLVKGRGVERRLEASDVEIAIRTVRHGRVLKEKCFPRGEVRKIRCSESGNSNGKPMKRITLWVGNREETLASWVDGDAADAFVTEVRRVL